MFCNFRNWWAMLWLHSPMSQIRLDKRIVELKNFIFHVCFETQFFQWLVLNQTRERRVLLFFFISTKTIRSRSPTPNTQLCNIVTCRLLFVALCSGNTLRSLDQKPNVFNVKLLFVSAGCVVQFDTDSVAWPESL